MKNMASDNHFLLSFFISRNPKEVFIKLSPILLSYGYILFSKGFWIKELIALFIGILFWSLFEYLVHRIVYHKRTKMKNIQWYLDAFHLHHHNNLQDYRVLNAGFLLIYPLTFFILTTLYFITNSISITTSFGLGMTLYYLFYEYVHYQIHFKKHQFGYFKMIQQYHLYHHYKNWNKNFGNTVSIWDRIFKTYDKKYKDLTLTDEQFKDLITKH